MIARSRPESTSHLKKEDIMSKRPIYFLFLVACGLAVNPGSADTPEDHSPFVISGVVVDDAGRPVSNALARIIREF